ncbi:MAG: class I tRNA ligase family protein, partial [Eggerthellaceae bacterium]|nr:class I tRNA ligase family protein [Eggerthellaceae bacterium]
IELSKASLKGDSDVRLAAQRNLIFVLDQALRLLHPAMPFVTESIWEQLPTSVGQESLMVSAWPEPDSLAQWIDDDAEQSIGLTVAVVSAVRATRARYGLSPKAQIAVSVKASEQDAQALSSQSDLVRSLANLSSLEVGPQVVRPAESAASVDSGCEIYCVLSGMVDFEAERARLEKERGAVQKDIEKLTKKLSNPGYLAKAAQEIIDKDTAKRAELEDQLTRLNTQLSELV